MREGISEVESLNRFWDKLMSFVGYRDEVDEYEEIIEDDYARDPMRGGEPPSRRGRLVSLPARGEGKPLKVVVMKVTKYDEVQQIADHLKGHRPVVVNMIEADYETAKRMIDFMSGVVYALNGASQRVGDGIFVFASENVEIGAEHAAVLRESGLFFFESRRG
jgi:cell division inhibitor SepF